MDARKLAGLHTCIHPAADRRNKGTPKDALVSLWLGLHSTCLAPALAANDTRPPSSTTERHVRAVSLKRRRADALALFGEDSVRSYPSWIAELSHKSPAGVDRRQYAYEHLGAGAALELVREHTDTKSDHAVSYCHRAVHLGYVPKQHHWIAEALDDGLRLTAIVENLKVGGIFRRRAKFIGTRIIVLHGGR